LLLATDNEAFHAAAEISKVEVFQGILNLAKENLTKEVANKLLLATDNDGSSVFHMATQRS
jgi:hypothetical protein